MSAIAVAEPAQPGTTYPLRPRIVADRPVADLEAAERAAADLLTALGLDLTRENLVDTPPGTRTLTSTVLGRLREDPSSRAEFLSLARRT